MKEAGNLIVVSGPSGAGKGTVCAALMEQCEALAYSVSATTRAPRAGEVHGVNYWFTGKEDFQAMIAGGKLLEWAEVYGNYYGTPLERVQEMLRAGKDVLLEIDTQGAMLVKEKWPTGVFIFIMPPSLAALNERIHKRATDSEESIARRLGAAAEEIRRARDYDYIVVNEVVGEAVADIAAILRAERCSAARRQDRISQVLGCKGECI